ncbi:MAG: protein phosphatase 2C domain-containing protein [Acidobacteriota bacterium]
MSSLGSGTWRRTELDRRALLTAGGTDPGIQREVNEDRFHIDTARGLFVIIDGVGGQAAGGRAADVALAMLRERLERETGSVADRIREAIAVANNDIHRLAATRAEWRGMACVLTVVVVGETSAKIGHVGDTRLYKIRGGHVEKITRDHSPVGEREDAGELSEAQAMKHPRRNEVYRDVGSEIHDPDDADFVDLETVSFEPDSALLLCTDGLTDLVDSNTISRILSQKAGDPESVVSALIEAANGAGGKDNVTVVYVEGEHFADKRAPLPLRRPSAATATDRSEAATAMSASEAPFARKRLRARHAFVVLAILALLAAVAGVGLMRKGFDFSWLQAPHSSVASTTAALDVQIVQPGGSIADALRGAAPESEIIVEPGEYREQLVLKDGVRLASRVPRGATLRLPASIPDGATVPAVMASGLLKAELLGFRIVGDAATPLAVGIRVENSALAIVDVEVTGATGAAIEFTGSSAGALLGSDIHDNPGAAIAVRDGAMPRIAHNGFARNGASERTSGPFILMPAARPRFTGNVFLGLTPDSFGSLDNAARLALKNENWFVPVSQRRVNPGPAGSRPQRSK